DGASVADAGGSFTSIEVGQGPVSALQVLFPGRFSEGDAEIWVANAASGTVSVVSSPLAITLFSATPSPVDLGSAIDFQLQYVGGAGPAEISYGGLPAGCASSNVSQLSCVPTESGSFTVTVTLNALFDGIATASTTVIVEGALEATETVTGAAASDFDVGSSVSFAAAVIGGLEPYAYLWEFGDGNSSTASSGTHAYTLPGTYAIELEVTDSLGATTVNVTSVTIHPDPVLRVLVTPSTTTDVDFPLSFVAAIAGGAAAVSEQWYVGTTLSGNGSTFSATWESSGHYNVTFAYTDAAGVSLEQVTPVVIEPPVRATVSVAYGNGSVPVGSGPVTVGESVELVAAVFGGTAPYVVDWNFGDGSFAVGLRAQHVYGAAGNYSATVNITDAVGGTISAPLTISVVAPASSPPPPSSSSSGSSNDLPEGVVLGALIGLALGAMVVYVATRSKRRGPPPPPSPYVPPAAAPAHSWKEE
ncbi:MAG TPA: PKD domain-containing protein, partial [Thermoplasmata archaeon]|nr:PKD domain-containing protein [Thermoplasmata archaeon]